ncbi:unnamed protein product [Staurois parvus]|uniref:Uncharacterized protein n=1 Tax=Staurois parvus TaxID=386267 RepID=A0ABN9B4D3_9NEOB|nr:unnamed protein product [Staurois parvus]
MLQYVTNLFISCPEDLVLSLQIMDSYKILNVVVFVVGCIHFCIN